MEHTTHRTERTDASNITSSIDNTILVLWGIFFLLFPFLLSTVTTDVFVLPRQILLLIITVVSLVLWGVKMLIEGKTKLRRTPFDLPVMLFTFFIFLSALFSVNRIDSLISFVPFLLLILSFIILINTIRNEAAILFLASTLLIGGAAIGLLSLLSFLKIYILPFGFTHAQFFTPMGSLVEQGYYFLFLLPLSLYFAYPVLKGNTTGKSITF